MQDIYGRKIDYLRISLTDRCNLKCIYCIPEEGVSYFPSDELLTKDEILKIVEASAKIGISKIKLTGGEPLLRKDLIEIVAGIHEIEGIAEISMTTNATLLKSLARPLKEAGLSQINISLDTINDHCFKQITLSDSYTKVYEGLLEAVAVGIKVKINCVPIKGVNEKEIIELIQKTTHLPIAIRFIELMPIGQGRKFEPILCKDLMRYLEVHFGTAHRMSEKLGNGPATYYNFEKIPQKIGFITAISEEFCSKCNRIRLTCNGYLKLCLHYSKGINLKELIQQGMSSNELASILEKSIYNKSEKHQFKTISHDKNNNDESLENHPMIQIGG